MKRAAKKAARLWAMLLAGALTVSGLPVYAADRTGEENVTYLSDLEWESAENGWGEVHKDASVQGSEITLTDSAGSPVVYEKGIGAHAQSKIVYDIGGQGYTRFRSDVGIDYSQNYEGSYSNVEFKIYFNSELSEPVYESGEMHSNTPYESVDLALDWSVKKLILVAEDGENNYNDHVNWADARFLTEYERGDKTRLEEAVEQARELDLTDYEDTDGNDFAQFREVLAEAEEVYGNDRASQAEIDEAAEALESVMGSLTERIPAEPEDFIVDVTAYGADPEGKEDSAEAVIKAVEKAKRLRAKAPDQEITINFPEGTYQIYPDKAQKRELYVSNTVGADQNYKMKTIGILIEDLDNVTVEGNGSEFIYHGKMTTFAAIRSEDVVFRNFSVDFAVPTVVDVTVESVDGNTAVVYVPECYEYSVENGQVRWYSDKSPYTGEYYWTGTDKFENNYNQSIDLETGITERSNALFDNRTGMEDLGNHRIRITYSSRPDSVDVGMCYQMRPTVRDNPGVFLWMSRDLSLENLDIKFLHGFGIVGQTSENITLSDVDFRAPENTGRTTAGYADFVQMSGCKGKITLEDCYFANPHDDPINIHGTFQQVVNISSDRREVTVRYMHNETAGFPSFAAGDQVEFTRQSDMLPVTDSVRTVEAVISGPTGESSDGVSLTDTVIRFTEPIPDEIWAGGYVAENITYTPEVEIRGNVFHQIPTRGILVTTRRPVVIEDNIFEGTSMAAIYISCDAQSWYESGRVEDVTIRSNKFYRCEGNGTIFIEPTNPYVSTDSTVHKNIRISGNEFYQSGNRVVDAKSVDGLVIEENRIFRFSPEISVTLTENGEKASAYSLAEGGRIGLAAETSAADLGSELFAFNGCTNVAIQDNVYDGGMNQRASIYNMGSEDIRIGAEEDISVNEDNRKGAAGPVFYETGDPDVAKVTPEGVLVGVSEGETTVTAYTLSGGKKYASEPVKVTVEGEGTDPSAVQFEEEQADVLAVGETLQMNAYVLPENCADTSVTWSVEDIETGEAPSEAEISAEGLLAAKEPGTVLVRASAVNGISAVMPVTITGEEEVLSDAFEVLRPAEGGWNTENGALCIRPTGNSEWATGNGASNIVLTEVPDTENVTVTVRVDGMTQKGYEEAGLVFYTDSDNYTAIQRKHGNGSPSLNVVTETGGSPWEGGIADPGWDSVYLKLEKEGSTVRGWYSQDGSEWILLQEVENTGLSGGFRAGILCCCGDGTTEFRFSELRINEADVPFTQEAVTPEISGLTASYDGSRGTLRAEYETSGRDTAYDVILWTASETEDGVFRIADGMEGREVQVPAGYSGYFFKPLVIPRLYTGISGEPVETEEAVRAESVVPEAVSNSELKSLACSGVPFDQFDRSRKYYAAAVSERTEAKFSLIPDAGASVKLLQNGTEVETEEENTWRAALKPGINAFEIFVTAEDGVTQSVYRYTALCFTGETEEPEEPSDPADKTSLSLVIAMAEKLEAEQAETGCYTEETWTAVQTALDAARTLAADVNASQEDVDNAFLELITAVNLLENAVQRVALQTAIEGARAILAEEEALADYTPESMENLRTVLAEAESVYALESADQETVNAAARSLMDAVTSLVVIDKDTRLDILIQKAEELLASADQYTAASVENLQAALDEARLTADNRDASEEQINAAYSDLAEAMSSMVRKADKSELKTALDKAAEILADTSKYVEESVAGLQAAADAAQAVYDKEDADAAEVGAAVKSLVDEILKARLMGDVDGNGAVDSADSAEVLGAVAEAQTFDEMQSLAADVNGDGAADTSDAAEILTYAAEQVDTL